MLAVVGLIVWILFTIGLTVIPFAIVTVSRLGGEFHYKIVLFCLVLLCLAAFSWANIFSIVDITIKGGDL